MSESGGSLVDQTLADSTLVLTPRIEKMHESDVCYAIRDEMVAIAQRANPAKVIVDMRNVRFVSSVGILSFLNLRREISGIRERILFCNVTKEILDMMQLCKLVSATPNDASPFGWAETLEAALEPQ